MSICRSYGLPLAPSNPYGFEEFDLVENDYQKENTAAIATVFLFAGDPWENRTPVTAVKGRCLSRLTNGPMVAGIGLEPMTYRV